MPLTNCILNACPAMLECLDSIYREYECATLWRDASGRSCLRGTEGQTAPLLLCDGVSGLGQRVGELCLDLEWITHTIKFLSEQQRKTAQLPQARGQPDGKEQFFSTDFKI